VRTDEVRVLCPTGILGYGFDAAAFQRLLDQQPHAIVVDAGSSDPGPHYLASGQPLTSTISTKRELTTLLLAAVAKNIPLIVGNAGGAGGRPHVDWTCNIIRKIVAEHDIHFTMAVIDSELDKQFVADKVRQGKTSILEGTDELTVDGVMSSVRIVAQMGSEPIIDALDAGAQVIIAGRACDDSVVSAYPVHKGFDQGLSLHMGKILECGAFCTVPFAMDAILGSIRNDHFLLDPGSLQRRCTVASVAGHSLYEREDPYEQNGPGGNLDLRNVRFEQHDDRRVQVSGSMWQPSDTTQMKIEGVSSVGYRTICIAGIRCPTMVEQIDNILPEAERRVRECFAGCPQYRLLFRVYGKNGVMGPLEPIDVVRSHELALLIEVVAPTQELAHALCQFASGHLLHCGYDGQLNNAGNLAFPYSPSEIDTGEVYEWSAYHLMEVDDPRSIFNTSMLEL